MIKYDRAYKNIIRLGCFSCRELSQDNYDSWICNYVKKYMEEVNRCQRDRDLSIAMNGM
jgi:hypothetical protein